MTEDTRILLVQVGSHAHGLATPSSDNDTRGVYVAPTEDFFRIGVNADKTRVFNDGTEDDTSWEVGHFLKLATKSNPSVLDIFNSPVIDATEDGRLLRELFPYVWGSKDVLNAFRGYGMSQMKRFMDVYTPTPRKAKFAVANIRVLYQAFTLLNTGEYPIYVADSVVGLTLKHYKSWAHLPEEELGPFPSVEFLANVRFWTEKLETIYNEKYAGKDREPDLDRINEFLLRIRKEHWEN